MATTRLMPLHTGKGRNTGKAIRDIIGYVANPSKTEQGQLVTGYACDPETADGEFLLMKREYLERTGRVRGKDDVIAYHLRQSFVPGEITPEEANRIGRELAERFTHGQHAFIVATHTDKHHIHNHIIFHSVNLDCDRKFRNFWGSTKAIQRLSDTLCVENGLSIVENPKRHGKSYNKWLGDQAKPSQREALRCAIDEALSQKPADLDSLFALLRDAGWEIKRGKRISLRGLGQTRFKRLDSLGENYTKDALRAILAGEKKHVPRKKVQTEKERHVGLLVDIQTKLQQGKGKGYERWAKVFNLKQMAQTLNYLSEHDLLDYEELAQRTETATQRYNEQAQIIQAAEKRMTEISALRTHIIQYVKTKDVYAAYRSAGYSKKFLAAHEQNIALHKAAKQAFDALGLQKLPTVKSLQSEYAALAEQKKHAYSEYRRARDEMRELLIVKANIDRLLDDKAEQSQQRSDESRANR